MESLNNILKKSLNKEFLSAIISNPREKGGIVKIKIRPVEHKDNILYQCEEHRNNQVFHHNLNEEEAAGYIENAMQEFKQMQMETRKFRYQVLVSKKGKMTIQRRLQTGRFKEIDLSHNRKKHYFLEFIDMEHTPKNILIRAIYTGNKGKNTEAIRTCEEMLHIDPMLGRLLDQQNEEGEKGV